MCTALQLETTDGILFGRNMDLPCHFGEDPMLLPVKAAYPAPFDADARRYAVMGMGAVIDGYPAFADGFNEAGLGGAALNFPGFALLGGREDAAVQIPPYHLLLTLLGECATVGEIRERLPHIRLIDRPLNPQTPMPTLHWMFSDRGGESIVVECTEEGLTAYENKHQVMANAPAFPWHMTNLRQYLPITAEYPTMDHMGAVSMKPLSDGVGALGLPGDFSSVSRFVRGAVFRSMQGVVDSEEGLSRFFGILQNLAMVRESVKTASGMKDGTVYACCMDLDRRIYYYKTEENCRLCGIHMKKELTEREELTVFPDSKRQDVFRKA